MTWYAFKGLNGGKAIDIAGIQEKEAATYGFHGYGTEAIAEAHPNSVNFLTRYIADLLIADYKTAVAQGEQPGGPNANILNPINDIKGAAQGAVNEIPGVGAIGDFFHRLTEASTWVRVGEFIVGGMLIYVGIRAATQPGGAGAAARGGRKQASGIGGGIKKVYERTTPTGRAERVVTRHKARVKASDTRQHATVIRGKQREFSRRELYP